MGGIPTVSSFMPLLGDIANAEQGDLLIAHLTEDTGFGAYLPVRQPGRDIPSSTRPLLVGTRVACHQLAAMEGLAKTGSRL